MPKKTAELSAIQVRRIADRGLHAVGGVTGLYLQVARGGSRSWILRAKIGAKRRDIGLGGYPDVTLTQARDSAREARQSIRQGIDPAARREAAKQALIAEQTKRITFAEAARRKHSSIAHEFRNPKHAKQWLSSLERHAFPVLADMDVADIEVAHLLAVLEPIWQTKTETASRVRQRMEAVFAWAIAGGHRGEPNPAALKDNLQHLLPAASKIRKVKHHPALPWDAIPAFMADLRQREGMAARALEFTILTAARSGEVRLATWDEFDLDAGLWIVPAERIKAGKLHTVPLPEAALAILRDVPKMAGSDYVFPAKRGGALSDMALSAVTQRIHKANAKTGGPGYIDPVNGRVVVPHGFRSSFKDWARNSTSAADEVSELALAHVNSDATRAAYARDQLLPARKRMMQQWAQFLSKPAAKSAKVTNIGEAR